MGVILFVALGSLRILEKVDPRWTLPIWTQAFIVVCLTSWILACRGGSKLIIRCLPILLIGLTAAPLPTALEQPFIAGLTSSVVTGATSLLGILGKSVESIGNQIVSSEGTVEVTEGCSGIRSAQSFFMTALVFGEWFILSKPARFALLLIGLIVAWTLNVGRATGLALIRFDAGNQGIDRWHDGIGMLTFLVGATILLFSANWLNNSKPNLKVIRSV